jgi:hypothetical protein
MAARRHFAREQTPKKATPHAAMPMVLSRPLAAARIARLRGCARVFPESMSPSHTANGAAPRSAGMSGQMHLDDLFGDAPASGEGGAPAHDAQPRMAIARRLKHAREQASYETASAAAIAFGWAPSRYLAHESGERPIASKQLAIYAAAFAVDYRWLQAGDGPVPAAAPAPRPGADMRKAAPRPSEAMLKAARQAIFRVAVARGLVPASLPAADAMALAETWRELADAAVLAAWDARARDP